MKRILSLPLRLALAAGMAATLAACQNARHPVEAAPKPAALPSAAGTPLLTGQDALGDWLTDAPGVRRRLTVADLPVPYATPSVDNGAHMVGRPEGAMPKAPAGFAVEQFTTDVNNPRRMITAPNGDIFVAESGPNRVKILRAADGAIKPDTVSIFADGLRQPFGLALYPLGPNPQWLYVANTDSVVRFPYKNGDLKTTGAEQSIVPDLPGGGRLRGGGHWSRDLAFRNDGKKMFVSVGSHSNVSDDADEFHRADILEFNPDGTGLRVYASGIRNPVGIAVQPQTGTLWTSVNERDVLGDFLVPDYITHVQDGGFYGWPWYYIGSHQDPNHKGKHPELNGHVLVPDVLLQSHMASLCLTFYTGRQFPRPYQGGIFAAEHGSWNRSHRTGYNVIYVPLSKSGQASGEYDDFLTGFVTGDGDVWGRPVGVTVAHDGSLLVSDDGSNSIWRVHYVGAARTTAHR